MALLDWMFILYTKSNFLQARASLSCAPGVGALLFYAPRLGAHVLCAPGLVLLSL